jgi:hypothetical protein
MVRSGAAEFDVLLRQHTSADAAPVTVPYQDLDGTKVKVG